MNTTLNKYLPEDLINLVGDYHYINKSNERFNFKKVLFNVKNIRTLRNLEIPFNKMTPDLNHLYEVSKFNYKFNHIEVMFNIERIKYFKSKCFYCFNYFCDCGLSRDSDEDDDEDD